MDNNCCINGDCESETLPLLLDAAATAAEGSSSSSSGSTTTTDARTSPNTTVDDYKLLYCCVGLHGLLVSATVFNGLACASYALLSVYHYANTSCESYSSFSTNEGVAYLCFGVVFLLANGYCTTVVHVEEQLKIVLRTTVLSPAAYLLAANYIFLLFELLTNWPDDKLGALIWCINVVLGLASDALALLFTIVWNAIQEVGLSKVWTNGCRCLCSSSGRAV